MDAKGPSDDPKLSRFYGAGEAMVKSPNEKMIGYNRSTTEPMRLSPSMSVIRTRLSSIQSLCPRQVIGTVLTARRSLSVSLGKRRATTSRAPRHRHGLSAEPRAKIVRPEDENQESNPAPRVPFRS